MRILHFEDDVFKKADIEKVIATAGQHEVVWVRNVEDGLRRVREANGAHTPFDLIITDMHFPLSAGGEDCVRAGEVVMEELEKRGADIPVIVCSSMNIRPARAYGSVWYSSISDWDMELQDMLQSLQRRIKDAKRTHSPGILPGT